MMNGIKIILLTVDLSKRDINDIIQYNKNKYKMNKMILIY